MLDADLAAALRGRDPVLVQAVKRNLTRFPGDFMFQLTRRGVRGFEITVCDLKR